MQINNLKIATLLGATAVALGAFAAHGLKKIATPETITVFETAVKYQFYHVFALALCAIISQKFKNKFIDLASLFFIIGITLFSGSLYLLTFFKIMSYNNFQIIGAITPFGGLFLIAGWCCLGFGVGKNQ